MVEVITEEEEDRRNMQDRMRESNNAAYYLAPGENPQKKIRDNLFLKVLVDKKNVFVGEPVTATFKLYSRLVYPGGGGARSVYSGPPIQINVKRPAIFGSISHALARSVSPAPQTTYNGNLVSSLIASFTIAFVASDFCGVLSFSNAELDPW